MYLPAHLSLKLRCLAALACTIFFLAIGTPMAVAAQHVPTTLRDLYYAAYKDKNAAQKLLDITGAQQSATPVLLGYKAVAAIMMCNHLQNPYSRLKYFYRGKNELEKAIALSPADTELRFLRFAVQCNVPGILNYAQNIPNDRQLLISYLLQPQNRQTDEDLYRRIHRYMTNSSDVPEHDRKRLKAIQG